MTTNRALSVNMMTAILLLELFVVAIGLAFFVTLSTGTFEMQAISLALTATMIVVSLAFIYYCRKRESWSYTGASVLRVLGVASRAVVSTQPSLESAEGRHRA